MKIRVWEKFSSIMDPRLGSSLRNLDRYGGKTVEYSALSGQFRRDLRLTPGSARDAWCQNVRLLFGKQHGLRLELLP